MTIYHDINFRSYCLVQFKQRVEVSHIIAPTSQCSSMLVWASHAAPAPAPAPAPPAAAFAAVHWQAGTLHSAQAWRERGESVVWDCEATSRAGGLLEVTLRLLKLCCLLRGLCWWGCGRQRLGWAKNRLSYLIVIEQEQNGNSLMIKLSEWAQSKVKVRSIWNLKLLSAQGQTCKCKTLFECKVCVLHRFLQMFWYILSIRKFRNKTKQITTRVPQSHMVNKYRNLHHTICIKYNTEQGRSHIISYFCGPVL